MSLLKKDINIQIGQRVRFAREKAQLSREELAEKLDISTLFLGYIECGQKGMSLTTLQNICTVLGVSSDYILLGIENTETSKKSIHLLIDSIDNKYLPLLEYQLRSILHTISEIERINKEFPDHHENFSK